MPSYLFKDDADCRHELFMSYEELKSRQYKKDGQSGDFIKHEVGGEVVELKRLYVPFGSSPSSVWPKRSMSMGVGEHQIKEAMEADRKAGIRVEYDPKTGDAIHTSMQHRRQHMKVLGMIDKDAYI